MKIKLQNNLKDYSGLTSSVVFSYIIALSPIITIFLALVSLIFKGENSSLGTLSFQIYLYPIIFLIIFLYFDLYSIIYKKRKLDPIKTTIKTKPELFILLGFLIWNIVATVIQILLFDKSLALTTIIFPLGVQEGLFAFTVYGLCLLLAYFVKHEKITQNILFAFLISLTIISIFAIMDPNNNFFFQNYSNTTWAGMFFNSNHFGYVLTLSTTLAAVGFVLTDVKWKRIVCLVLFTLFTVTSFFVDTFGSLIGLFCALLLIPIVLCWFKKKFDWKYVVPLGVFIILSFVMIPLGNWKYYSTYESFFSQVGNLIKDFITILTDVSDSAPTTDAAKSAGTGRWGLWLQAFEEIEQSPIVGTGNVLLRPHNEYLQFAQVWGLPSLIIYLSAFIVMMVKVIKHRSKLSNLTLCLLFPIIAYLISAMFGNTMPHTTPFFALFVGFFIRWLNYDINRQNEPAEDNIIENIN